MNVNQIKQILLDLITDPASGWEKHRSDFSSENEILSQFAIPVIALGAAASLVHSIVWSGNLTAGVLFAAIGAVIQIVALYVISFIVKFIASKFEANPSSLESFRFVAFGNAAGWIGQVLTIVPILGALAAMVLSIYGIYIMYKGITPILGVSDSKRLPFFIVTAVVGIIAGIIIASVIGAVGALALGASALTGAIPH